MKNVIKNKKSPRQIPGAYQLIRAWKTRRYLVIPEAPIILRLLIGSPPFYRASIITPEIPLVKDPVPHKNFLYFNYRHYKSQNKFIVKIFLNPVFLQYHHYLQNRIDVIDKLLSLYRLYIRLSILFAVLFYGLC